MKRRVRHSRLYLWWHWRKITKEQFPCRYTGPDTSFIQYGVPLKAVPGPKGGVGGRRWLSPDGLVRVINTKQVEER